MISMEFAIIKDINNLSICLEDYNYVSVDDDIYMNDWYVKTKNMDTYFHSLDRPAKGFDRWGFTIIPPCSLNEFYNVVINDKRLKKDNNLKKLAEFIENAMKENKYMIHFGV